MSNDFCWYELMTTDRKAAAAFYESVVGWRIQDADMPGMPYTLLCVGDTHVGGVMELPADARKAGMRSAWIGYVEVDDVDAYAKRVTQAGGAIHRPPDDIPSVGRFSIVADPQGAMIVLFKSLKASAPQLASRAPGTTGWHELHAGNGESAFAFYSGLFGWKKSRAMDMGPMGTYQLFMTGTEDAGGMMTKTAETPAPFWLYYFVVDAIDAAAGRVKQKGGQVINGPMEVPGGAWIIQCLDPQGAMFALTAAKR